MLRSWTVAPVPVVGTRLAPVPSASHPGFPLASQPPRGWPRGALPPASDKVQPRGAALGSWLTCPPAPLTSLRVCVSPWGEEDRWGAFHCGWPVTVAPRLLDNAKGSISPQQVASLGPGPIFLENVGLPPSPATSPRTAF